MNKRFILAVFTALALTMGFTSCDKEDENNYQMDVFVRVNHVSSDADESDLIVDAYAKALGASYSESVPIATIAGKDSLACVSKIVDKCAKAESQLKGETWSDSTSVSICTYAEKNGVILYTKEYGKSSGNTYGEVIYHYPGVQMRLQYFIQSFPVKTRHSATAMYVQTQGYYTRGWASDYPFTCVCDLNESAGGSYVYGIFDANAESTLQNVQQLLLSGKEEELDKYIADVLVLVSDSYIGSLPSFTYDGVKYEYAHGIYGDSVMWDLNKGAGGPYLYLYYSHDVQHFKRVIDVEESKIVQCLVNSDYDADTAITLERTHPSGWHQSAFVKSVKYQNGNIVKHNDAVDLNEGAGGDWLRMRADYITFDCLRNLKFNDDGSVIVP